MEVAPAERTTSPRATATSAPEGGAVSVAVAAAAAAVAVALAKSQVVSAMVMMDGAFILFYFASKKFCFAWLFEIVIPSGCAFQAVDSIMLNANLIDAELNATVVASKIVRITPACMNTRSHAGLAKRKPSPAV